MDKRTRVVVTGMGVVSAIGIGVNKFWRNLIAGKSGISKVSSFDTRDSRTHKGGEIKNFNPRRFTNHPEKMGRATQLLLAAVKLAIEDARLDLPRLKSSGTGVLVGVTALEPTGFEKITRISVNKGIDKIPSSLIAKHTLCISSTAIGRELGFSGFNMVISTACTAGNYTIGYGFDLLKMGKAKTFFCCGVDAFSKVIFTGFNRLFAVDPKKCRPFDKKRQGMMLGEGAGVLVLETLESALERKANIYAEVLGYGLSCDAYHMSIPSKGGIKKVMERAIKNSRIKKGDIDYISAHGTGTINNDRAEAGAIREIFGGAAKNIPVSSIKSMIGHTLGSASSIEAISCCLTIKENIIPPTINFETPDPQCNINLVANKAKMKKVDVAMNNSFAFGGNNACVIFKRLKK